MARISIDPRRRLGEVDRRIFGGFIEHLGRCIYGGIYEEGSPLSDEHGYRLDVLEALQALRMPLLRWPGGNFVSGYHWLDGVGPKEQRPRKIELAWHSEESNRFGTDEYIDYCRRLGTEPYICVNMGNGSIDEAQAWVEYCNGTSDTHWANLRRANGHPEPYNVRYWGLGNEVYGTWQIGALSAEDYVKKAIEFAKVMRWTDPTIKLVGCGDLGFTNWDRVVLEGLAPYVDYHSVHIYTGSDHYLSNVLAPHQAERALRICQALIDRVRYQQKIAHPIHVAYDEWNVWYRARKAETRLEERYNLADALAVATYLNVFVRQCNTVKIANLAQAVNAIAPIFTNPEGLFLQTIYHPFQLMSSHTQAQVVDCFVQCEQIQLPAAEESSPRPHRVADLGPFPVLDVATTLSEDGRSLALSVINRDPERAQTAELALAAGGWQGELVVYEVNGAAVTTENSFAQPQAVSVVERRQSAGAQPQLSFAPHSHTVVRATLTG